jgi:hypothetical protein
MCHAKSKKIVQLEDTLRIHAKWLNFRYVDDLPKFKAQRIIIFLADAQPSN